MVTLTSSTLIDHIHTTCVDSITASGVHKVSLSDHYLVFCARKLNAVIGVGDKQVTARRMKRYNEQAFSGRCFKYLLGANCS